MLVTGRLGYGMTNTTGTFPFNGTELGTAAGFVVRAPSEYRHHREEERATAGKVEYMGGDVVLGVLLEQWDADVIAAIWPSTVSRTGDRIVLWPGTPGVHVTPLANILFWPHNPAHPGVILFSAAPRLAQGAELFLSITRKLSPPVLFVGLPNASGQVGEMGIASKLTVA
jgi:hypothetical protein